MIAAVFDCMVYLQAVTNANGPSGACLAFVEGGHVQLFLSAAVLEEVHRVLNRRDIRTSFPQLTNEYIESVIDYLLAKATILDDIPVVHRLPRDPDDEQYLNLAIAAEASFIVSWDPDLSDLMDEAWFRKAHPALSIVNPVRFLTHVRGVLGKKAA